MEDFNALKMIVKKAVRKKYRMSYNFRLEFDDQPEDFDFYVKDVTHGPTEISNEPMKIGSVTLTFPVSAEPVTISMTVMDDEDGRMSSWFDNWSGGVVFSDGTVALPYGVNGFLRNVRRYSISTDGKESLMNSWAVFPVQRGDVTESREDSGVLEFPITFIQFRT